MLTTKRGLYPFVDAGRGAFLSAGIRSNDQRRRSFLNTNHCHEQEEEKAAESDPTGNTIPTGKDRRIAATSDHRPRSAY